MIFTKCLKLNSSLIIPVVIAAITVGCTTTPVAPKSAGPKVFFPNLPDAPRVQFLMSFNEESVVVETKTNRLEDLLLGPDKSKKMTIMKPYGIAANDGAVYICDTLAFNVKKFDFKNKSVSELGSKSGPGKLTKPVNISIDPDGYKFVVDVAKNQVAVFDPADKFLHSYRAPKPSHIVDVAVNGSELYVLDNDSTPAVHVLSREDGSHLRSFGAQGSMAGEFFKPVSIDCDPAGNIVVTDMLNFRIQKLSPKGESIWVHGRLGRRLGEFSRPRGICVGPDGVIYVVETAFEIVQMFSEKADVLMPMGGHGLNPGALILPAGVATDKSSLPYFQEYVHPDFRAEYLVFVTSQGGPNAVSVYAFGSFPEGYKYGKEITALPKPKSSKPSGLPMPQLPQANAVDTIKKDDSKPVSEDGASTGKPSPGTLPTPTVKTSEPDPKAIATPTAVSGTKSGAATPVN